MARLRLVDLVRPFLPVTLEVEKPLQKVEGNEKLMWTAGSGILYLILSELPLWGLSATATKGPDPVASLRPSLASSRASPLELGVGPIILSGAVLQICAAHKRISVSLDTPQDRMLFQTLQKFVALLCYVLLAIGYTLGGGYGPLKPLASVAVIAQLIGGSFLLVWMDEILQKDWGLLSGPLLFTVLSSSQKFVWDALSVNGVSTETGPKTFGAIPSLLFDLKNRSIKFAVVDSVYRQNLPSLIDVVCAISVFAAAIYVNCMRLPIPIRSTRTRAQTQNLPIRLVYTGAVPLQILTAALFLVLLVSSTLFGLLPDNPVVKIIGTWNEGRAVNGIAYYIAPLSTFDPIKIVFYLVMLPLAGGLLARAWLRASGSDYIDIAKQFKENYIVILGKRETSNVRELRKVIPLAATIGGIAIGAIVAVSDIFGRPGWGASVTIFVLNGWSAIETLYQDGVLGQLPGMPGVA